MPKGYFFHLFFFKSLFFNCVFVCAYIHMYVQVPVRPEDSNGPLRLKLQDVVSCPTEMPKTEVKPCYREHTSQIVQWEQRERESYTILWTKLTMIGLARKGVIYLFSQTIEESYFINIPMYSSEASLYNIVQA